MGELEAVLRTGRAPQSGALLYLLTAPSDDEVRYVGQTLHAGRRLAAHLRAGRQYLAGLARRDRNRQLPLEALEVGESPLGDGPWRVAAPADAGSLPEWLAGLLAQGRWPRMPVVEVLDCRGTCCCRRVSECARAAGREAFWIDWYVRRGHRLLNRVIPSGSWAGCASGLTR